MELTRDKAKDNLTKLVEKFERELAANRIKEYNEEATKTAFIQTAKGSQKDQIQRQIEKTDKTIDQKVYELYRLTSNEIEIIEGC